MGTYLLNKEIPVCPHSYDLVVAGGGPGGVAAAIAAGRLGAKVLLIEKTGCLGGMATSGLVTAFDPMANGETMLVGGIMREIVETLHKEGGLGPQVTPDYYLKRYHCWTPFRVEALKALLDRLALDAGVEIRFFTTLIDADAGRDHVNGVVVNSIEGYEYIPAKTFIDATGDAVLAKLCGAPVLEAGRDGEPEAMPPTLTSLFSGIDWTVVDRSQEHPLLLKAIEDGVFTDKDRHLPGMSQVGRTLGYLNGGHIFHADALRVADLTRGMILGRKKAQEYTTFYKRYLNGCQNIEHVTTASLLGVRESRRIVGEYQLNFSDYLARRWFPDQIGVFNKFVDIHVHDASDEEYERFEEEHNKSGRLGIGESFGIPYSILVPKGYDNLWVAGRCNSSDVKVHGSIRVQPAAAMMGQAAGAAAAQAIATGQPACDLDTEQLVLTLRGQGANLPQQTLSKQMTRA